MLVPIYTVGDGKRTQLARRADGQWFTRTYAPRWGWSKWDACRPSLYMFSRYIDTRAGQARLPDAD